MLYGNLIFIKKTGGDGSKFPVTEKVVNIGTSEDCLVRIYNPQVAAEHCQLIVQDNKQTTLRNLSNGTVLNGQSLGEGDVILCHGDVFKVGKRLVRWEYLPTSKYYRQLLSPSGRLVAVVMPQQRSVGGLATPGTSASQVSVLKNTPLRKKRFSNKHLTEASSTVKIRKSSGTDLICKARRDLPKLLAGRHSLKTTKLLLHGAKLKDRKSISGTVSSKTPKGKFGGKSRKSTLPSWKVNILSPSQQESSSRNSPSKSSKKSAKLPENGVKTPLKNMLNSESSKKLLLSVSKSALKTPQKIMMDSKSSGASTKSASKSISKTRFTSIGESPSLKSERSVKSTRFSKSPSPKKTSPKSLSKIVLSTPKPKPPKLAKLAHSESKLNSQAGRRKPEGSYKMNLILERVEYGQGFKNMGDSVAREKAKVSEGIVSDSVMESSVKRTLLNGSTPVREKQTRKSVKGTPAKKTPGKAGKTPRKSSLKKTHKSPTEVKVKTPRKSRIQTPGSLAQRTASLSTSEVGAEVIVKTPRLSDLNSTPISEKARYNSRKSVKSTAIKKTAGKLFESVEKMKSPASPSQKISIRQNETISFTSQNICAPESVQRSTSSTGRKSGIVEASLKKSLSFPKSNTSSPRGVRRKLSPSSSAERAAKKLKTSSPIKPDKNKKAALLVLGKANRKQLSQNMKVLLKQKIVKKAIKQSTALTSQKESKTKAAAAAKLEKGLRKTALKSRKKPAGKKKSLDKISPPKNSKMSTASTIECPAKDKTQEETSKGNTFFEGSQPSALKAQAFPNLSLKGKQFETPEISPSKQNRKLDSPGSNTLSKSSASSSWRPDEFDKAVESYLFNSNRRSKRLSSKNDIGRPDFIELSPTALGLMPKNVNIFQTLKDNKRRSSSLVTPKNAGSTGIMKSASTSKIRKRMTVTFPSNCVSSKSEFQSPVIPEKVNFDFSSYQTPDVTVDIFVSPLTDKSSLTKKDVSEFKGTSGTGDISNPSMPNARGSSSGPNTCVRKLLQSPQVKRLSKISPVGNSLLQSSRTTAVKSPSPSKLARGSKGFRKNKSPKNDLSDLKGVRQLFVTRKPQNPKNDLTDIKGIKKLFQTPKVQKSPKNDLTDVRGVKKLLQTPKVQKSPKNDLTDVRGVKKLLQTPKVQKSPKNDLTDVRGVKKLLQTPKVQKSPKNDLTDVRGVKRLMGRAKSQKSPKNDLTNLDGVKELLRSPRVQKSPKNDLSDLRGVKELFTALRDQKSPKNCLLEVSGLGNLFDSPADLMKVPINSPKSVENWSGSAGDVTGPNHLLLSKSRKSISKSKRAGPWNNYKGIRGRPKIYSTPKVPKNDLSDLTGVRELFSRHKPTSDYNVNLTGVAEIFDLPNSEVDSEPKKRRSRGRPKLSEREPKSPPGKALRSRIELRRDKPVLRRTVSNEGTVYETRRRATSRRNASKNAEEEEEETPAERKTVEKIETSQVKKTPRVAKKSEKVSKKETKTIGKSKARTQRESASEVKSSRKRKGLLEESETPPAKSRRKLPAVETGSSVAGTLRNSRRSLSKSRKKTVSEENVPLKRVKEIRSSTKAKGTKATSKVQSKTTVKTGTKRVQKVQNRSRSSSKTNSSRQTKPSPRKTRSAKSGARETADKKVSKKQSETVGRKMRGM